MKSMLKVLLLLTLLSKEINCQDAATDAEEETEITQVQPGVICSQILKNSATLDVVFDSGYHCKSSIYRMFNESGSVGDQCNFWLWDPNYNANEKPWPKDCKLFQTNTCDKYEISRDGKSVDSC